MQHDGWTALSAIGWTYISAVGLSCSVADSWRNTPAKKSDGDADV